MDHIRVLEGKGTSVVTQGCFGTLADLAGLRPITAEGISLGPRAGHSAVHQGR